MAIDLKGEASVILCTLSTLVHPIDLHNILNMTLYRSTVLYTPPHTCCVSNKVFSMQECTISVQYKAYFQETLPSLLSILIFGMVNIIVTANPLLNFSQ